MPPALAGERREIHGRAGRLCCYRALPASAAEPRPLLLIHSVNAAAGAHEVRPLYDLYASQRPVYALDLPGYGSSDRGKRPYTPRLMTDALLDVLAEIRSEHGDAPIDALALSLSCEFLSRVAIETPKAIRSLALVSPTAFNKNEALRAAPGTHRGIPWLLKILQLPGWGEFLFRLLTTPASIRFFLQKTWGSKQIDEGVFDYACLTTKQPGAERAPFYFLSRYLFSADIHTLYAGLEQPVWMSHGTKGDFTDYRLKSSFQDRGNWRIQAFPTGALPYFEATAEFVAAYDSFLASLEAQGKDSGA